MKKDRRHHHRHTWRQQAAARGILANPDMLRGASIVTPRAAAWLAAGGRLAPPIERDRPRDAGSRTGAKTSARHAMLRRRLELAEASLAADNYRAARRWGLRHLKTA